jgi:hypothetical protein
MKQYFKQLELQLSQLVSLSVLRFYSNLLQVLSNQGMHHGTTIGKLSKEN